MSVYTKSCTPSPRKLPAHLYLVAIALAGAAYLIPTVTERISSFGQPQNITEQAADATKQVLSIGDQVNVATITDVGIQSATGYDYTQFVPRVPTMPESAPAYDEIRQVVNMPRVAGGICRPTECKCYTQQGTDAGLTSDDCRAWINDKPFDPYTQPPQPAPDAPQQLAQFRPGTERLDPNQLPSAANINTLDLKF